MVKRRESTEHILGFIKGIIPQNPVFARAIPLASIILATTTFQNAMVISVCCAIITIPPLLIASMIRKKLPFWVRVIVYVLVASSFCAPAIFIVQKLFGAVPGELNLALPLLSINAIILHRAERFAIKNRTIFVLYDSLCYVLGFAIGVLSISAVREILAYNTILGIPVGLGYKFPIFEMPFGGFMLLAFSMALYQFAANKFHSKHTRAQDTMFM